MVYFLQFDKNYRFDDINLIFLHKKYPSYLISEESL